MRLECNTNQAITSYTTSPHDETNCATSDAIRRNPAAVLLDALDEPDLDARVAEGLPWLALTYVDMDWDWLVRNAKLQDRQNRLAFAVSLAAELAEGKGESEKAQMLRRCLERLERARLACEDAFCHDSMTEAERAWLRDHRSPVAGHWNLLTDMESKNLVMPPNKPTRTRGIPFCGSWMGSVFTTLKPRVEAARTKMHERSLKHQEALLSETSKFLSLTFIAAVVAFGYILWGCSILSSKTRVQTFYIASATISFAALLWILLDSIGVLPRRVQSQELLLILIYRGWVVIGTAISSVVLILMDMAAGTTFRFREATRSFVSSPYLLRGVSLSVSISFICTEIGKVAHHAEMREFFVQSGYPVWFLYLVIAAETRGAVGLFFPRTLLAAASGLTLIMAGAISTHLRNRDPFPDSLEALHLLVLLACIIVIRLLGERALPSQSSETGAVRNPIPADHTQP